MDKVQEYANLVELKKGLEKRLAELKSAILADYMEGKHVVGEVELTVQVKDRTTYDEDLVHKVMRSKRLDKEEYCRLVVDPDAVEVLWLDGTITDTDLREMRKPQYSIALTTKKVSDVQE